MAERPYDGPDPDRPPGPAAPGRRSWWRRLADGGSDARPARLEGSADRTDAAATGSELGAAARRRGWSVCERDASLGAVLADAPLRLTHEHLAAPVTRGWVGSWELVAFDVVYVMPRGNLSQALYAVTALPVPIPLPAVRVAPRRFLSHGTAGLLVLTTGDEGFDARWRVLADQDTPEVRGLVAEQLRAALLAGPDVDELWTAAGHLAVSRVDGHHDTLLGAHAALLTAAMAGLQRAL